MLLAVARLQPGNAVQQTLGIRGRRSRCSVSSIDAHSLSEISTAPFAALAGDGEWRAVGDGLVDHRLQIVARFGIADGSAWQGYGQSLVQCQCGAMPHLAHIALVVRDYDEALAFYVGKLGFTLVEDTYQPEQDKRWVTIRPPGAPANATTILLARASTPDQAHYIGDQAGGRVFLFLRHRRFRARSRRLHRRRGRMGPPARRPDYGKVAVFLDLYGNRWDLIEFAPGHPGAA